MQRVLIIADLHCGHRFGLTHPDFDARPDCDPGQKAYKRYRLRRHFWTWFITAIEALRPIDVLIVNGDLIDGKGGKSGGIEMLTTDRTEQTDMAAVTIDLINAPRVYITFGTPYHSGVNETWESEVARKIDHCNEIDTQLLINVNDVIFHCKHYVGRSDTPYGKYTALGREMTWASLKQHEGIFPRGSLITVRSHCHYLVQIVDGPDQEGIVTPALQLCTIYGGTTKSSIIHTGLVYYDVEDARSWNMGRKIFENKQRLAVQK